MPPNIHTLTGEERSLPCRAPPCDASTRTKSWTDCCSAWGGPETSSDLTFRIYGLSRNTGRFDHIGGNQVQKMFSNITIFKTKSSLARVASVEVTQMPRVRGPAEPTSFCSSYGSEASACVSGGVHDKSQHSRTHLVSYLAVAQLRLRLGPGSQKLKPQLVENKNNLSAC